MDLIKELNQFMININESVFKKPWFYIILDTNR